MSVWYSAFKEVVEEIKKLLAKKKEKKTKSYEAVEAVRRACIETTVFLEGIQKADKPNKELINIWLTAATKVRELDEDLYLRLLAKADYWSDPKKWTKEKVKEANIALDVIKEDVNLILAD